MSVEIRHAGDFTKTAWRNGQGMTTELAREDAPNTAAGFFWRASVAQVTASSAFSIFPDVERSLTLLSGSGFALDFENGGHQIVDRIYQTIRFAGDVAVDCRLLGGPCEDLNIMVARGMGTVQVMQRRSNTRTAGAKRSLFYVIDGDWTLSLTDAGYAMGKHGLAILKDELGQPVSLIGSGVVTQVDIF
jgi:environmental stress-induced protein Ves